VVTTRSGFLACAMAAEGAAIIAKTTAEASASAPRIHLLMTMYVLSKRAGEQPLPFTIVGIVRN
jgi:hypothetical protein